MNDDRSIVESLKRETEIPNLDRYSNRFNDLTFFNSFNEP